MNNIFSLQRFGHYTRKELRENWQLMMLFLLALMAMQFYYVFVGIQPIMDVNYYKLVRGYRINPYNSLIVTSALSISLVAAFTLRHYSNSQKAISALLLPVSIVERVTFALIVSMVVGFLMALGTWAAAWGVAIPVVKLYFPKAYVDFSSLYVNTYTMFMFTTASGVFMCGAVAFGRLNYLKTLVLFVGVIILTNLSTKSLLESSLPPMQELTFFAYPNYAPYLFLKVNQNTVFYPISTYADLHQFWWVFVVPVALWTITYLKLKEKEV